MRSLSDKQLYLNYRKTSSLKIVKEYRWKYEAIDKILNENPGILKACHKDLQKLSTSGKEISGTYTTENILRTILVMYIEQDSYRDVITRITGHNFLEHFIRLENREMMDFTFLCKAHKCISADTWGKINTILTRYSLKENKISGEKTRADTTVYDANIHYPSDSSLLWDSYRVFSRLMKRGKKHISGMQFKHRFHPKKVKSIQYKIVRNVNKRKKGTKRYLKKMYRKLIARVEWILEVSNKFVGFQGMSFALDKIIEEIEDYQPVVEKIIDQAKRRVLYGESVPNQEKVFSLFESHTELIKKGKASKPLEFGHMVSIVQTGEKYRCDGFQGYS